MSVLSDTYELTAQAVIRNLNRRNMEGYYCENSEQAVKKALELMPAGSSIAWGGSESVKECGLMDAIHNGDYHIIDRMDAKTPEEQRQMYARIVLSDYFLMSSNAITLEGELVNIDGNGNRVAALVHGPQNIIIIAGMNKITADIESAYKRVKVNACPANAVRLKRNIPCAVTGACGNCLADECFCNQIVITRRSGQKNRIKVILVGESLGF